MSVVSKCPKCYDEAMGCNTGEIDQNGYLDCLCGAADARVAMEKELGLFEAPQWARDKAWRAYSMGRSAEQSGKDTKFEGRDNWIKGDDFTSSDSLPTAGIHIGSHGNAVEFYGENLSVAQARRDLVLSLLKGSP